MTALVFLLLIILSANTVFAYNLELGKSRISPASPFYFLKSAREALEIKFAGTTHIRALYKMEFANRRVREVNSLIQTPQEDLIQPTLEKYWSLMQELKGITSLSNQDMAKRVSGGAVSQMSDLQENYSKASDPKAKRSIRTHIHRLSEWEQDLIDKLDLIEPAMPALIAEIAASKLSACYFLSQEASAAALNEVEKEVFATRSKKCFLNLRPVSRSRD